MQNQPVLTGLHIDEIIQRKPDSFRGALGDDDRNFEKNRIVGIQWKKSTLSTKLPPPELLTVWVDVQPFTSKRLSGAGKT